MGTTINWLLHKSTLKNLKILLSVVLTGGVLRSFLLLAMILI